MNNPNPERIQVEQLNGNLNIHYHWYRWTAVALAIFTVIWNGIALFIVFTSLLREPPNTDGGDWFFGSITVLVGVWLIYLTLMSFYNRTIVAADNRRFRVFIKPFPWRGARSIASDDIQKFLVATQIHSTRRAGNTASGTTTSYHIHVQLKDQQKLRFMANIHKKTEAKYLVHILNQFLEPVMDAQTDND